MLNKENLLKERQKEAQFLIEGTIADSIVMGAGIMSGNPKSMINSMEETLKYVIELDAGYNYTLEALNMLAQIAVQRNKHKQTFAYLKKVIAIANKEDIASVVLRVAEKYEDGKKYDRAIKIYEKVPKHLMTASLHNSLSYCYGKLGIHKKAVIYGEMSIKEQPKNEAFLNDLGYSYLESGELKKARKYFEKALEIKNDYELAENNLKDCLERMENEKT